MNNFYTYAYLREDGTPYYIGKGKGKRIYKNEYRSCPVPKDRNYIIFLKQNLTEEEAFKHEKYMISVLGRKDLGTGILRNMTNGGEGISGLVHTEKTKRKISESRKGKLHTEETKRKYSETRKGKKVHSEEWKKHLSERMKGNKFGLNKKPTPETIKKRSEKLKGRVMSEEQKKKLSDAHKGKKLTEEHKRNISKVNKGKKLTDDHKRKIREANRNREVICNVLWTIENIYTKEVIQVINLSEWCRNNSLSSGTLNRTQTHTKHHKGYKIISKVLVV